ncbi:DUF997 family protein, partial [Proteus mirabilis]
LTAYLPDNSVGLTGLPVWFELSCLFLPVLFFLMGHLNLVHKEHRLFSSLQ